MSLYVRPAGTLLSDFSSLMPSTWTVVFVSRRQVCYSVSPGAGHSTVVGDHSQGLRP